jgi:guanylate kinase
MRPLEKKYILISTNETSGKKTIVEKLFNYMRVNACLSLTIMDTLLYYNTELSN